MTFGEGGKEETRSPVGRRPQWSRRERKVVWTRVVALHRAKGELQGPRLTSVLGMVAMSPASRILPGTGRVLIKHQWKEGLNKSSGNGDGKGALLVRIPFIAGDRNSAQTGSSENEYYWFK